MTIILAAKLQKKIYIRKKIKKTCSYQRIFVILLREISKGYIIGVAGGNHSIMLLRTYGVPWQDIATHFAATIAPCR